MWGLRFWFKIQEYPGQGVSRVMTVTLVLLATIPFQTQWDGGWWVMGDGVTV